MDMEGVLQDGLRKFKKECEEMTCEYFAAIKRMGEHVGRNLGDSVSALEVDGMRPQLDMALQMKFFEGSMKCLDENQRKMTNFFEDEMSALVIAAAPVIKPLTASTKPAGNDDERKTAEAAAPTSANIAVGYSPMFVGYIPRSMAGAELQEIFQTEAIPGRYHRKRKYGFAKVLVRNSEIDRALNQDSVAFGRKFRVEKWKQLAKAPSSRAQGRTTKISSCQLAIIFECSFRKNC